MIVAVIALVLGGGGLAPAIGVSRPLGIVLLTFVVGLCWGSAGVLKRGHVGVRKRILVAASSLGMYIVLVLVAVGLADITGTRYRVSLLAVTVLAVCFLAALGIRTRRSRRR